MKIFYCKTVQLTDYFRIGEYLGTVIIRIGKLCIVKDSKFAAKQIYVKFINII